MKKNRIRNIVTHNSGHIDDGALTDEIGLFYVQAMERRLNRLPLTAEQKIAVIDRVIEILRSREGRESGG